MSNKLERRNTTHEFRVSPEGEQPTIAGYAALFNTLSDDLGGWREEIDPRSFDNVLKTNPDVRALWNHNPDCILGRTLADTLHLSIDNRGLSYVIDAPNTSLANDLIVSMRRKDITQSSFGFVCKRDQWTENPDGTITRRILEFDELLDVSPVTYPAYSATTSQARSLPSSMPVELRSKLSTRDTSTDPDADQLDCDCDCGQCMAGACGICSNDPQCSYADRSIKLDTTKMRMQMQLDLINLG